ncbi:proline-rich protein 22 [Candoia aspera]|uniref:proline-rich protein 22 n=1 Tax=Candoia aspera TaxID=51853 RepID=UPI002FD8144D
MQQPKLFYPPHETYASRPLERPDGQPSRAFPAFVLPESLASVGAPSLYHPPSQDLCATPPAGFHMAPCGCFFDPRIYRIEWATANFVQPSVYKLSSGPGQQSSYLLDNQKYLKGPVQPLPYPPYQPVASNPPFAMPFFKPEGSPAKLTDHVGFVANLAHGPPFVEVPRLPGESLVHVEDHKLLAAVPGSSLKEQQRGQAGPYQPLDPGPGPGLAFRALASFPAEEADFKGGEAPVEIGEPALAPGAHPEDPAAACEGAGALGPCLSLEGIVPREPPLLEEPEEAFHLLDQVPLEDAMKLFDCSPANSDTEASLEELGQGGLGAPPGAESGREGCLSGEDSSSDIRSLNLPDELLSFDYSVPEILSAVTSLDYLYDVNAFGEEASWDSRPPSQPLPRRGSPPDAEERRKDAAAPAAKRGKAGAGKPEPAAGQRGGGETPEADPALPAV